MLMKFLVDTATFLRSVLNKEVGLRTGSLMSHVAVFEIEGMGYRFTLGDVTEVPGLLYPFHPGVGWRNGRILFFFTRKKK